MQPQFITLHPNAKDISGKQFGRMHAIGPVSRTKSRMIKWLCQCVCGNTKIVPGSRLRFGDVRSCGCLVGDTNQVTHVTHGMANHPLYKIWTGIIKRCTNPNAEAYKNYGGRGIELCKEWRHDFSAFYNYVSALEHYGEPGYSIDRINNDGNYESGNLRYATRLEQSHNSRRLLTKTEHHARR